uniref:exodeoxyribonuclease III n=1 Tax=Leptobrachium leishanense TaxID=445787 RepID=A0A8C5P9J2_9ANUR
WARSLLSYNVRGLNTPQKRTKILQELRAQRTAVAFLQETHFQGDSSPTLRDRFFPTGYFSNFEGGKSRGVAILLAREVPFKEEGVQRDQNGRFLFIKGTIGGALYTFASIYLPNKAQHRSLSTILRELSAFREVVAGDFNAPLDPRTDTSAGRSSIPYHVLRHMPSKRRVLNDLLDANIRFAAQRTKCYFALKENRPGRYLAHMLHKGREAN